MPGLQRPTPKIKVATFVTIAVRNPRVNKNTDTIMYKENREKRIINNSQVEG